MERWWISAESRLDVYKRQYTLYFSSLRYLKGQEAAILSYIDPLVAVLVSVTVLAESVTWLQAAGGAMILGFTILNELKPKGAA